jgi:tRNA 2-thiocytidine biosynthesis protein TtcA
MFEIADALRCNKIALGHNQDDLIETFFMNICYAGEVSTMVPRQDFFDGRFTVIRPLAMVDADRIRRFAEAAKLPRFTNPCPSAGNTKRSEIGAMLQRLYRRNPKVRGNVYRAMSHVRTEYLLK